MSSLMRRLRKSTPGWERRWAIKGRERKRLLEARTFERERKRLFARLVEADRQFGKGDGPVNFLAFLKRQRRGYDPAHDGPSKLMKLVDDIASLDAREKEWASGKKT